MNIKFKKNVDPLRMYKKDISKIAKLAFSLWESDYKKAESRWNKQELSKIEEKIKNHNKLVKKSKKLQKYKYFNTNFLINRHAHNKIIEEEKLFYIHTKCGLYEWKSKFNLNFDNGKTLISESPTIISKTEDKIEGFLFDVSDKNNKRIEINIGNSPFFVENYLEVQGDDEIWVQGVVSSLTSVIDNSKNRFSFFYRLYFQSLVSSLVAIMATISLYSIFNKIAPNNNIYEGYIVIVSVTFIAYVSFKMLIFLGKVFPYFEEKDNSNKVKLNIFVALIMGLFVNFVYDVIKFLI